MNIYTPKMKWFAPAEGVKPMCLSMGDARTRSAPFSDEERQEDMGKDLVKAALYLLMNNPELTA